MSSISSGLRLFRRLSGVDPEDAAEAVVLYRTPSTTQIGALDNESEDTPRMRMVGAPPTTGLGSTTTPGLFCRMRSVALWIGFVSTFLPTSPRVETAFPS